MDYSFEKNINKTFFHISSRRLTFNPVLLFGCSDIVITPHPIFYYHESDGMLSAKQQKSLGFYVLPQAIRAILKSINFHTAGDLCKDASLLGPSVLNYYTAAFHNVEAYMALNGVLFFSPPIFLKSDKLQKIEKKIIIARYSTKKNRWFFENGKTNHRRKWEELVPVFKKLPAGLPDFFNEFYCYFFGRHLSQGGHEVKLPDNIKMFLTLIANTRHTALYYSFGGEPEIVDDVMNMDTFSLEGIEKKAVEYKKFSLGFLLETLGGVTQLINHLEFDKKGKEALLSSVFMYSYFDEVSEGRIFEKEIMDAYSKLAEWLFNPRKRKVN